MTIKWSRMKRTQTGDEEDIKMKLTSTAFRQKEAIPAKYTGEGNDVSPPLAWEDTPDGTVQFALICDDPDAPTQEPWIHWILYGLGSDVTSLPEGSSGGGREGRNSFGNIGYNGPMPPPGHGEHRYYFVLYALDAEINLPEGAEKSELLDTIKGHILEKTELLGTYER